MDLARYFGGDVRSIHARMATLKFDIEVEDTSVATLDFESGALASVENAWTATGWEESFHVYGTQGALECSNRLGKARLRFLNRETGHGDWRPATRPGTTTPAPTTRTPAASCTSWKASNRASPSCAAARTAAKASGWSSARTRAPAPARPSPSARPDPLTRRGRAAHFTHAWPYRGARPGRILTV